MGKARTSELGVLSPENEERRDELVDLLTTAYWMELESVMNYIASSTNPDGLRAQEVVEALEQDIDEELGHGRQLAARIKELYGVVPGSESFEATQSYLQPPDKQTDIVHVIEGVIEAETHAIAHYQRIVELCDDLDLVTQDMVIGLLRDEQAHRRLFEGFLRELEEGPGPES
jgi:bacterioferritin